MLYTIDLSTGNSVRSNNLSWKYQRFMSSGCKVLGIRKNSVCGNNTIPLYIERGIVDLSTESPTTDLS